MAETWRLLDTGLGSAARNIALARAMLEARDADEIPSTLRFLRFTRSALLGCNDSAAQVLNVDGCRAHDIAVQRRLTGGGALYVDERHLGWELFLHRRDVAGAALRVVSQRVAHAAATAISALGANARCRPPGDIEVDARTIASGGIAIDGQALVFQGVLTLENDALLRSAAIRAGAAPEGAAAAMLAQSRAGLRELLGYAPDPRIVKHNLIEAFESEFDVEFLEGELSLSEERRFLIASKEIDTQGWVDLDAGREGRRCRE